MSYVIKLAILLMVAGMCYGETALDVAKRFEKCEGEATKSTNLLPVVGGHFLECSRLGTVAKHCVYQCVAQKLNIIQANGTVSKKVAKSYYKQIGMFSKKKTLLNRLFKCVEGMVFPARVGKCPVAETAWNCILAAYDDVCSGVKPPADNLAAQAEPLNNFYDDDDA